MAIQRGQGGGITTEREFAVRVLLDIPEHHNVRYIALSGDAQTRIQHLSNEAHTYKVQPLIHTTST